MKSRMEWNRMEAGPEWERMREFLMREPLQNIYHLGALHNGHIAAGQPSFYGGYRSGELRSVMLVCKDLHLTYGVIAATPETPEPIEGFDPHRHHIRLMLGRTGEMDALQACWPADLVRRVTQFSFTETKPEDFRMPETEGARFATMADLGRLVALYKDYSLDGYRGEEMVRQAILGFMRGTGYTLLEVDGEIVTVVRVMTEYPGAALIDGAYTPPQHRRKGYHERVSGLMRQTLIDRGQVPVSFQALKNVAIRSLVAGLGGRATAEWKIFHLTQPPKPWHHKLTHRLSRLVFGK